jgi:hypothetical protein
MSAQARKRRAARRAVTHAEARWSRTLQQTGPYILTVPQGVDVEAALRELGEYLERLPPACAPVDK